jgi:hypothetical protein
MIEVAIYNVIVVNYIFELNLDDGARCKLGGRLLVYFTLRAICCAVRQLSATYFTF